MLCLKAGKCLVADGRIKEAVNLFEDDYYRRTKFQYAEDHHFQLTSQYMLAIAIQADGQIRKAVNLCHRLSVRS